LRNGKRAAPPCVNRAKKGPSNCAIFSASKADTGEVEGVTEKGDTIWEGGKVPGHVRQTRSSAPRWSRRPTNVSHSNSLETEHRGHMSNSRKERDKRHFSFKVRSQTVLNGKRLWVKQTVWSTRAAVVQKGEIGKDGDTVEGEKGENS